LDEGKPHANRTCLETSKNRHALADRMRGHTHCVHRQTTDSYARVSVRCRNGVVLHGTVYAIHLACVTSQRSHNREDCPWNIDQVVIYKGLDHNGCYIARNQVTASLERLVDPGFSN
jgi:hypothetical protein